MNYILLEIDGLIQPVSIIEYNNLPELWDIPEASHTVYKAYRHKNV